MTKLEIHKTLNILALAFLLLSLIFHNSLPAVIAALLMAGNAMESSITGIIAGYWIKFAEVLGRINSRIILTAVFFLFFTPLAWLYRKFNKTAVNKFWGEPHESVRRSGWRIFQKLFERPW